MNNKKYTIECTEEQLRIIADCVEDCCRFAAGQLELFHTTSKLENYSKITDELSKLKNLVTPDLPYNASYGWNGGTCPDDIQRKFIAKTYPIYREILHFLAIENQWENVYSSSTLTCEEGGEPVIINKLNNKAKKVKKINNKN